MLDRLGPMSSYTAQLIENAFEEEQHAYAIEALEIAYRQGLHPTRDLFLALLAIVVAAPDQQRIHRRPDKRDERRLDRVRRLDRYELRDIDRTTTTAAICLLNQLVEAAPRAVRSFLPPFDQSDGQEDASRQAGERNWLRGYDGHEGRSDPDDSRSTGSSINANQLIRLAGRMLDCHNVWQLLSLDPVREDEMLGATKRQGAKQRTSRRHLDASREGDEDNEEAARTAAKFDRPGTWIILSALLQLWRRERHNVGNKGHAGSLWDLHLVRQFARIKRKSTEQSPITDVGHAFGLVRASLMPIPPRQERDGKGSHRSIDDARRVKCGAGTLLLTELLHLTEDQLLDRQAVERGTADTIEAADFFSVNVLFGMEVRTQTTFVMAAIRFLEIDRAEADATGWDAKMKDLLVKCTSSAALPNGERGLLEAIHKSAAWLTHKADWSDGESDDLAKYTNGVPAALQEQVLQWLSHKSWQLFERETPGRRKVSATKRKRNDDSDADDEHLALLRLDGLLIAGHIRLRTIDRIVIRARVQLGILETVRFLTISSAPGTTTALRTLHGDLQRLASRMSKEHEANVNADILAVRCCFHGMQTTYKSEIDGLGDRRGETVKQMTEWSYIVRRLERYIEVLEADLYLLRCFKDKLEEQEPAADSRPSSDSEMSEVEEVL